MTAATGEATNSGPLTRFRALVESEPEPLRTQLREQDQRIRDVYAGLSAQYQESKGDNDIPFD